MSRTITRVSTDTGGDETVNNITELDTTITESNSSSDGISDVQSLEADKTRSINNQNKNIYLASIKSIGTDIQFPTADLNFIPLYGQSLADAYESDIQLTTANVGGNRQIGNHPYYLPSFVGFTNLIAGTLANSKEYANIHFANRLKIEIDKSSFSGTADNKMLVNTMGKGGNAIEQLSKGWTQGLVGGLNQYEYGFLGSLNQAKTEADSSGETIVCHSIMWIQGEANSVGVWGTNRDGTTPTGNPTKVKATYKSYLLDLKNDMQNDIISVLGQTKKPLFFMSVNGARHSTNFDNPIQMAQLEFADENDDVIISNPTYFAPDNGSHLSSNGYRLLGESFGKKGYQTFIENKKHPALKPSLIEITGSSVLINIPTLHPLKTDTNTVKPQTDLGFEVKKDGTLVSINSIVVEDTFITIDCNQTLTGTIEVAYANNQNGSSDLAIVGHGNIRNTDNFPSLYNWGDDTSSSFFGNRTWEALADDGVTKLTSTTQPYHCYDWLLPFYYSFSI